MGREVEGEEWRNGGRKVLAARDEELADGSPPWGLTTVGLGQDRGSQLLNAPIRGKEYTGAKPSGPSVTRLYPKLYSAARKIFTRAIFRGRNRDRVPEIWQGISPSLYYYYYHSILWHRIIYGCSEFDGEFYKNEILLYSSIRC